jgi:hypothetical protein
VKSTEATLVAFLLASCALLVSPWLKPGQGLHVRGTSQRTGHGILQFRKERLGGDASAKNAKHDEVAKAALFPVLSDSSHTTGELLNVSGGRLMN